MMGNYYGSDLNEFIGNNCPHDFTTINIDCLTLKWETKTLRFIEAKHEYEPIGRQQYKALKFLAERINCLIYEGWNFELFITIGNSPYESLIVQDVVRNRKFRITGQSNVINWLSFKVELQDIAEEITLNRDGQYQRLAI